MMDHIHLADWADTAVLAPATAAVINRLASGVPSARDPLTTLFLAYEINRKPWLIAPAMNRRMWAHPSVTASVKKLSTWGVTVVPPGQGHQACGDIGEGRLAEPQVIHRAILGSLNHTGAAKK